MVGREQHECRACSCNNPDRDAVRVAAHRIAALHGLLGLSHADAIERIARESDEGQNCVSQWPSVARNVVSGWLATRKRVHWR